MKRFDQSGSHIIAVAVGLLVLGVIGFAGYTVANRHDTSKDATTTAFTPTSSAPISSSADLKTIEDELDTSSTSVSNDLNDSALDADLNDLL